MYGAHTSAAKPDLVRALTSIASSSFGPAGSSPAATASGTVQAVRGPEPTFSYPGDRQHGGLAGVRGVLVHSLAWPAGVVAVVLVLRKYIGVALSRGVRRLKAGPVEVEFDQFLVERLGRIACSQDTGSPARRFSDSFVHLSLCGQYRAGDACQRLAVPFSPGSR
jgi:hypothetical protein